MTNKTAVGLVVFACSGCATVDPGHMGLMFRGLSGGLQRDKLSPGVYYVAPFNRIEDFDISYSTHKEKIETTSQEGLRITAREVDRPGVVEDAVAVAVQGRDGECFRHPGGGR